MGQSTVTVAAVAPERTFSITARLRDLAAAAVARAQQPPACQRHETQTAAYFGPLAELPLPERQARSLAAAMVAEPVRLFPGERLHGLVYGGADPQWHSGEWAEHSAVIAAQQRTAAEVPELAALVRQPPGGESFLIDGGGAPGHIAWNWHWLLAQGADGLLATVREREATAADERARSFYQGAGILLTAMLEWNQCHVAALCAQRAAATDPLERQRLAEAVELLTRVPAQPARTFHEALQSFWFQWLAVMYEVPYGGNSPGRFDYFLWPYLRDDLAAGRETLQSAGELVAELFIKLDERIHAVDGNVNTIVLGGRGPDGADAVSPLSWLLLDVFEQLDLTHPAVYTRVSAANPPAWRERCARYLLTGGNRAQLLADEPIIAAMTRDGRMPEADAAMYMCGGCMELSPHGLNSDLLFSFTYNLPKTLELVLTGGECLTTGQPRLAVPGGLRDCAGFEELWSLYEGETRRALQTKFRQLDLYCDEMARCRPAFLQSVMVSDCLERGRSLQDGGARYADYGGAPLGAQNVADSLYAVEQAVFEQGFCDADELLAALRADFVGHERLHRRLQALPKYGLGDAGADGMMARVLRSVCGIFDDWRTRWGGRVKPMMFTFVWAPQMGRSLGASPDGRRAGQPIGHGLTPQAAGMAQGLTASMGSCLSLPTELVSGGATTMWDLDADWVTEPLVQAVVAAFVQQGGQIFQGNMTSVADLRAALERPDDYRHLFVRVGGFSARFTSLGRDLQAEIIARHRHRN